MLEILYQDEQLVAINKPAGLLVHRSMLDRHATEFAMQMLRDQLGRHVYPVHRLDRPTSGVLLFALNPEMARSMTELFSERSVKKRYLALVRGYLPDQGLIDYPLKPRLDKLADADVSQDKEAQEAQTEYRCLGKVELPYAVISRYPTSRYSLALLSPLTGRKHQLRRHMEHLYHPMIGDTTHGEGRHNRFFREHFGVSRLLLHSLSLEFIHPESNEPVCIEASLDEAMGGLLQTLGWSQELWQS
ncbi:tRNA pseudouridine(65) synthase TruC [Dongshaea marina]|uniref:tRNA pseudouridine(65) synthase TruC n=1 Tax=Dongshaea marina TaxID=2047966 RepID=UPI000D3EE099|nr:tRNA pseudouridine(65) synthase TruC [Dongshaea marina]